MSGYDEMEKFRIESAVHFAKMSFFAGVCLTTLVFALVLLGVLIGVVLL